VVVRGRLWEIGLGREGLANHDRSCGSIGVDKALSQSQQANCSLWPGAYGPLIASCSLRFPFRRSILRSRSSSHYQE
jgi:hypothetical protein